MAFLYSGPDPVQRGVAPGTIQTARSSLVRGSVQQRGGRPLAGVRVAIKDHPEYGFTYSRADGRYDLVVNAAEFTVDFQLAGFCPAHRPVRAGAQNSAVTEDVTLVPLDRVSTVVSFGTNAPLQVALSSTNSDAAGPRSATILVPPGTCASMLLPDGTTQDCRGLTLRVTEFTVGADGVQAMPAPLPPTTGYTYCAEFSADEALAAGVGTVMFSQPVPIYVDNFLNLPVGTLVPIGSYDRELAAWVPSPNGIVLKVLGVSAGLAQVDVHGLDRPEPAEVLASLGMTTAELQRLAGLYPAGKTLWRAPVPHFSSWDFNAGLRQPDPSKPKRPGDKPKPNGCDNCGDDYGTVNFSSQVFREHLPLVGVPFGLHYSSARVPGYRVDNHLTIPVAYDPPAGGCGDLAGGMICMTPPPPVPTGIRVETDIAGASTRQDLPPDARTATVTWDGRDAYGRLLGGTRIANITIAYEFPSMEYLGTCCGPEFFNQFPALFGNFGNLNAFTGHAGTRTPPAPCSSNS
ncbi:hypothetical protein [Methanothrix soehngenii]|uniref:hypothetical protein n=1 Tax=Methanothrix soehngenii TaxID=2223 RepID=UPI00300CAFC2